MTDETAPAEVTPPADAAPAAGPSESSPADPELLTRRVLLHEILLEEYETHRPADTARATRRPLPDALKESAQPWLEKRDLEAIERAGRVGREECTRIEGEQKRARAEDDYNAGLASDFFILLTKAQRAEAEATLGSGNEWAREEYLKKLTEAWKNIPEDERPSGPLAFYLDRALAHEVYGFMDDLREKQRRATAHITNEEARREEIDRRALEAWLRSLRETKTAGSNGARPGGAAAGPAASAVKQDKEARAQSILQELMKALSDAVAEQAGEDEAAAAESPESPDEGDGGGGTTTGGAS